MLMAMSVSAIAAAQAIDVDFLRELGAIHSVFTDTRRYGKSLPANPNGRNRNNW